MKKKSLAQKLRQERQKGLYWGIVTAVILVFCVIFILYPFGKLFAQSFVQDGKFSLANYAKFFGRASYRKVLWNTAKVSICATLLGVALGEWKGTGAKTRGALVAGLVVLAASIGIAVVAKTI